MVLECNLELLVGFCLVNVMCISALDTSADIHIKLKGCPSSATVLGVGRLEQTSKTCIFYISVLYGDFPFKGGE